MFWILLSMLLILGVAGLVATYVVYPRRGAAMPRLPWLGSALQRGVDALPTLGNQQRQHRERYP